MIVLGNILGPAMTDTLNTPDCSSARRAYQAPAVVEYGTLRDVTLTVGTLSAKNDGGGGNTKTA